MRFFFEKCMMSRWPVGLVVFFFMAVAHAQDALERPDVMDATAVIPADSMASILDPKLKRAAVSLRAGNPRVAVAELRGILQQTPAHPQALRLLAAAHLRMENFAGAIETCRQLSVQDSTDAGVLIALGYLNQRRDSMALAEQFYLRGLELDPNIIAAYQGLGWLYLETGRTERALDMVGETTERAPGYAPNYILLGRALTVQGFFADAAIAYSRAFALQSDLRERYGILLQELGLRHPSRH